MRSPLTLYIQPFKAGFTLFLAIWGFHGARDYSKFWLVHGFDLIIHEAGHAIFRLLGEFMMFLGGTLMQLLVPIAITGYFWYHRQRYSATVTTFWVAINLFDISIYMKDARTQALPLLGGEAVTHDWFYLFGRLGWLSKDQQIGSFVYFLGCVLGIIAIAGGFYLAVSLTNPRTKPRNSRSSG
ncbi:MAG: hypothetical protein SFT94_01650 [Pseudanabaenaceae cyanobacterium bins.68]|nr:hypothetical protein [Pseudanabaenaceae cyanobacterium bins.68]